jgi:anti-anti-sigma factor
MFSVDLTVRECDDHVIVALGGELDLADAAEVVGALTKSAAGRRKTIVDLAGLMFIDCSGAAALARAQKQVRRSGGALLLAAPRPLVRRVFVLSRLIGMVGLYATVEQATGDCELCGWPAPARPGALSLSPGRRAKTGRRACCREPGVVRELSPLARRCRR